MSWLWYNYFCPVLIVHVYSHVHVDYMNIHVYYSVIVRLNFLAAALSHDRSFSMTPLAAGMKQAFVIYNFDIIIIRNWLKMLQIMF